MGNWKFIDAYPAKYNYSKKLHRHSNITESGREKCSFIPTSLKVLCSLLAPEGASFMWLFFQQAPCARPLHKPPVQIPNIEIVIS